MKLKRNIIFVSLLCAGIMGASSAFAGGFAVREQSASGLGSAFAGVAAGGDLSSIFWNPAALAVSSGTNTESHASLIIPDTSLTAQPGSTLLGPPFAGNFGAQSGDIADLALVPASYLGHQFTDYNPNFFVGVGLNSPFGLVTEPDNSNWAGSNHGRTADLFTINVNPVAAYRISPNFMVGAGLQVESMDLRFKFASGPAVGAASAVLDADDISFGFTAGALWQPMPGTSIGVGFRSSVEHELEGTFSVVGLGVLSSTKATLETPETVTVSLRQAITKNTRVLGTFEWSNWSRLDQVDAIAVTPTPLGAFTGLTPGAVIESIPLNWEDGYFYSVGLEHDFNPALTVRAGVAYEESPVQAATSRLAQLPDSDRIWASIGATYRWNKNITLDLAYTHIFFEDAQVNRQVTRAASPINPIQLLADVDNSTDIIAVSFKYKFGDEPEPPLK